ncbi:MAG: putative NADH-flavin reductase [Myxococcota bacterium]|jgi:putative NADH-flavin reductase
MKLNRWRHVQVSPQSRDTPVGATLDANPTKEFPMSAALNTHRLPTPKSIVIFGATGGTGRQLVAQALARGLDLTVFVRNVAKLDMHHPNLRVITGDLNDAAAVRAAVASHDAVFAAVGAGPRNTGRIREISHRHILDAMTAEGVERLVTLSMLGVGDSQGNLTPFLRYVFLPLYLRRVAADHAKQEQAVKESGLAWTIVRPPHLNNGPAVAAFRHGFGAEAKGLTMKVSRADVASFMLDQLTDGRYLGQTPGISN